MKLEGSLTVENSRKHKEALLDAIRSAHDASGELAMDVSGIEAIDIAGMQLLIALVRECRDRSIPIRFTGTPPSAVRKRLYDAALINNESDEGFALIPELYA